MFKDRKDKIQKETEFTQNPDLKRNKEKRDFKKITVGFTEEEYVRLEELSFKTDRSKLGCIRAGLRILAKKELER
ncbi:hypothetical protein AB834_00140 [PVC group bacterium (ex Bugula neritina AB1)]|nr:hypothetical protein AB834_00140 [PVC group bacterium (ex Bugula neritina AB1)]